MANFYAQYPASSASANASVGVTNTTAPGSATEVGFIDGSGNLQPFSGTSTATGPNVAVTSSALPTGGATAANQVTGNNSLSSIDGKTPTLGQALAAASIPVVLTTAQIAALTPLTTVTANQGSAGGSAWPVSLASSPLPTGAATAANQATEIGSLATIATNTTNAATTTLQTTGNTSLASILAANSDVLITGAGPATAVINTNILLATTGTAATDLIGYRSISFQVNTGAATTAVAVNFEASNDNVNFVAAPMYDKTTPTAAPVTTFTTAASTSRYFEGPTEFRYFRVRLVAAITAGTIQVFSTQRTATYQMTNNSLAAGTQSIGNIGTVATVTTVSTVSAVTAVTTVGTVTNPVPLKAGQGTLTDRSGTTSVTPSTSTVVAAVNASRKYFIIQNTSTVNTIWINFTTAATAAQPSLELLPGGSFVMESTYVTTEAINVVCTVASSPFAAKEG